MSGKRKQMTEGRGRRARVATMKGDKKFWEIFFALYLNRNRLPLSAAYKHGVDMAKRQNPFAVIPSIGQARYQIKLMPASKIYYERIGTIPESNDSEPSAQPVSKTTVCKSGCQEHHISFPNFHDFLCGRIN